MNNWESRQNIHAQWQDNHFVRRDRQSGEIEDRDRISMLTTEERMSRLSCRQVGWMFCTKTGLSIKLRHNIKAYPEIDDVPSSVLSGGISVP